MRLRLALTLAVAIVASCAREEPARVPDRPVRNESPTTGGTLIRRLDSDVVTLNPVLVTSRYDRLVLAYLFVPLVQLNENLQPVAGLAERWEISPDGRSYTFHLNRRATFSDRVPVRASDVLFTLRKIADPQSQAAQVAAGFEQLDLTRTRVIDDHTIVVGFREALASQMIRFNDLLVVPEHVYSKGEFTTAFTSSATGTGPYRLVRRDPGKEIVLELRDDYWGRQTFIKTVIFKVIVDATTAWNALKRGDIDETSISSDVWSAESARPDLREKIDFRRFYTLNYNFIAWNGRNVLFGDKRVRRALSMCVDLQSIINGLYRGTARAMNGPFTPDDWAYDPSIPVIRYDPAEARRILSSVGWLDTNSDGVLDRNGKPFSFDLLIFAGSTTAAPFAQLLQENLQKVGVRMNIVSLEPATLIQRILGGRFEAAYMAWDLDPDPDPFSAFHSSQFAPRGQNFVYYQNQEADRLIEQARRELDRGKRREIYQTLHRIMADDQPYTWTIQVSSKWAVTRRVHGIRESKGWGLFGWYPGELGWWVKENTGR